MIVFSWASWNGATYYIDVFGRRMEKELNELRKEVQRMAQSPELAGQGQDGGGGDAGAGKASALDLGPAAQQDGDFHMRKSGDVANVSDGLTVKKGVEGMVNGEAS